jgi:hypothetical protein
MSGMPTWLQVAVGVVALLSFGLSLFLGYLKWEERQAKPDIGLDMDWLHGGGPTILKVAAVNRGKARGTVRDIVLSRGDDYDRANAFSFLAHWAEFPLMLEPGDVARFPIEVDPNAANTLTRDLVEGRLTHAHVFADSDSPRSFAIPPRREEGGNRVSLRAYVRKR